MGVFHAHYLLSPLLLCTFHSFSLGECARSLSASVRPSLPFPLPPCSTCLSKLGRARYTHSTVGGPCLLSINNLWNSEIQEGPVSGRLYHTLEGGLPGAHDRLSICSCHFSVCFRRSDCVLSVAQWPITRRQITSAAPCVWISWGIRWPSPVGTVSAWTASVATGMRPTTQGFTFVPSVRSHSPRGRCYGPTPRWAWWQRRSRRAVWTSARARPRGMFMQDRTMSHVTSVLGKSWRRSSPAWTAWRPTARSTCSLTMNQPPSKGTSWWTSWETWIGRSANSTRSPWSCSVEPTRCVSVPSAQSVNTGATILSLLRQKGARNR